MTNKEIINAIIHGDSSSKDEIKRVQTFSEKTEERKYIKLLYDFADRIDNYEETINGLRNKVTMSEMDFGIIKDTLEQVKQIVSSISELQVLSDDEARNFRLSVKKIIDAGIVDAIRGDSPHRQVVVAVLSSFVELLYFVPPHQDDLQ